MTFGNPESSPLRLGIVGAGTMGRGIALSALVSGCSVVLIDHSKEVLATARQTIRNRLERQKTGSIEHFVARLQTTSDVNCLSGLDIVIEAVFEDRDVKLRLLQELAPQLASVPVVATNTSALGVADLAKAAPRPGSFIGLHYFAPADTSPVVEVVRHPATADNTLRLATDFLRLTGKTPLSCKDRPGFAINRFFVPLLNEAAKIFAEGAGSPVQIDEVARDLFGAAAGPFRVMNLIKPVVALRAMQGLSALGSGYQPCPALVSVGDSGELWDIEERVPTAADPTAIAERLRRAVCGPLLELLSEEVAEATALDAASRLALQWSRGPLELLDGPVFP